MSELAHITGEQVNHEVAVAFRTGLLPLAGSLVVAVSGGQDSLALLHAMVSLAPPAIRIQAVHVDHGMRASSRTDAQRLARTARAIGVPLTVRRYAVAAWVNKMGGNAEASARAVRYRLLLQVARSCATEVIVTGHTGDDLVETVLLHIIRGTGPEGLIGLLPSQRLPVSAFGSAPPRLTAIQGAAQIVRPLLNVERWQTAAYCALHGLQWIEDSSNLDVTFTRNRIRHHLLPLLETYNPSVRGAVRKLATLARDDTQLIEGLVDAEWAMLATRSSMAVSFPRASLTSLSRAVVGRLIRRAARKLVGHAGLSFDQIDRCIRLVESGDGVINLSHGLEWRAKAESVSLGWMAQNARGVTREERNEGRG
ncbi:MAG: tRNA lysidine(34) synthetase TilS [Chloroflexota bacterium]